MNKTLIDNSENLKMVEKLKECINEKDINTIRIATGYWDIPGFALLADSLKTFLSRKGAKLRMIIGKDPNVSATTLKVKPVMDPSYPGDFIKADINSLGDNIVDEYKDAFQLLLDNCQGDYPKIDIHIYKTDENDEKQFFHSKCYIFTSDDDDEKEMYAILGSSNFTKKGLEGNSELNVLETDVPFINYHSNKGSNSTRKGYITWFEEKWAQTVEWTKEFIEQVIKPSKPVQKFEKEKEKEKEKAESLVFTPFEQYIKLLQMNFGDVIDKDLSQRIENYLPKSINKYEFQIQAVKRCISIMHKHGGFMLADVVGLGKTVIGMLIIKRFLSIPDIDGREHKVLIITPPAIKSGWKKTLREFDKDSEDKISKNIDFITTGSIGNILAEDDLETVEEDTETDNGEFSEQLQQKNYGLIIIDESHKFRNSNTQMYQSLDSLISKIKQTTGNYPYIGLLSATPQNNRPNDLKNQIYLFERNHKASTLKNAEGGNLDKFFKEAEKEYASLSKDYYELNDTERVKRVIALSMRIRNCVLTDILERRTRTDIKEYYENDMKEANLVFPQIVGPIPLEYKMDTELENIFRQTMISLSTSAEIEKLNIHGNYDFIQFYRYRAIEYFKDAENTKKYEGRGNRKVKDVSDQLATIMRNLLVKRLESSFTAFKKSLINLKRYTYNMIRMWDNDTIFVCPQIDINKELDADAKSVRRNTKVTFEDCISDIRKKIKKLDVEGKNEKKQNAEYKKKDFKSAYYNLLKDDYEILTSLCDKWNVMIQDPKMDRFRMALSTELFDPQKNESHKLVIFSESKDTVYAVKSVVEAMGHCPLAITADNRDKEEQTIEENFDTNYDHDKWKNDYDVIITTEVLAEGINLHRANVILNYDTPWNSTRLMQRIGRVNRIGSPYKDVYVYNFMPSKQGNDLIELKAKAHTKLQAFHTLFGEDSKVFTTDEMVFHFNLNKVADGEESPLEKYIYELKQYRDSYPKRYEQIADYKGDWQLAQNKDGNAYFVVKAPLSPMLDIAVDKNAENVKFISSIDFLDKMKCTEDTVSLPLPQNWKALCEKAIHSYSQHFIINDKIKGGSEASKANGVIRQLFAKVTSRHSRQLLGYARQLINWGNEDMIKAINALGDELNDKSPKLFGDITVEEIDALIEKTIGKMVEKFVSSHGNPKIKWATVK